jgi:hypothetical protein
MAWWNNDYFNSPMAWWNNDYFICILLPVLKEFKELLRKQATVEAFTYIDNVIKILMNLRDKKKKSSVKQNLYMDMHFLIYSTSVKNMPTDIIKIDFPKHMTSSFQQQGIHKINLAAPHFYWSACTKRIKCAVVLEVSIFPLSTIFFIWFWWFLSSFY